MENCPLSDLAETLLDPLCEVKKNRTNSFRAFLDTFAKNTLRNWQT